MSSDEKTSVHPQVRLRVELVVEIADPEALSRAALDRIEHDELLPHDERGHAREIVGKDAGEAVAYLVDPVDLVSGLPGVELSHASWGSDAAEADGDDAYWGFDDDPDDDSDDDSDLDDGGDGAGAGADEGDVGDDEEDVYDGPVGERAW